ncbi:hypothetical protein HanXRQr2_Chr05g0211191 [Helianthus annuus]|uniref:Uncharacterized protein n=1 Tax=Helianthus annuus TaxID=4232 RepID=A0A9K3IZ03_HELAN|nr:hypothetical protein HanXRQr2_Chr05g0211191 [Helianthus annuus]KAJ0922489.1 hypothetical protein HanPSC8_Chr05g0204441 [Helianthus annuus]
MLSTELEKVISCTMSSLLVCCSLLVSRLFYLFDCDFCVAGT